MAKMKKNLWKDDGWERGDEILGGNQGHTFFARKCTDPPGEFNYVLKKLKRQDKPDRRALFCGEVRNMDLLDHPGAIKVEATNAERFREDEELYFITRRILGDDLGTRVQAAPMPLEEALHVTLAVLRILKYCHERGVIHRDIKPCHVILPNGSLDDPVLIDFGLAFNRETQLTDAETRTGEGKGNRFLIGPEHLIGIPDVNRNPATDICQCVGLLFYAITQEYPRVLRDEAGKKPHERLATDWPGKLPAWKRKVLVHVFDVGFEWDPGRRWQSIDLLVERLEGLLGDSEPGDAEFESDLSSLVRRAEDDSPTRRTEHARRIATGLIEIVQSAVCVVTKQTEKYLSVECGRPSSHLDTVGRLEIIFKNKVDYSRTRVISFVVKLSEAGQINLLLTPFTGNLAIFENDQPIQLGCYDLGTSSECSQSLRPLIRQYLTRCVAEVLGVDSDSDRVPPVGA